MVRNISKAPGLKIFRRRGRVEAMWIARRDCAIAGFRPATVRLMPDPASDISGEEREAIYGERCRKLWSEMLAWVEQGGPREKVDRFDGTMKSLVSIYQQHAESPFRRCTTATRRNYVYYCRLIETGVGGRRIASLTGPDFRRWHANFMSPPGSTGEPKVRNAQAIMNMVRGILRFGAELRLGQSKDCYDILSDIEFPAPKRRSVFMTFEHAEAIVAKAIEMWRSTDRRVFLSIALGQAFQFELALRQSDVIGVWEKITTPTKLPAGAVKHEHEVWFPGLLWEAIDLERNRLAGETNKTGTPFDFDLSLYPMVRAVIALVPAEYRKGPVIVTQKGEPFRWMVYSQRWREVATAAGVPAGIMNRDSRAGAVTEATDAGAPLESVRHASQHSNVQTTARYSRNAAEKTAEVARIRVASRKPTKGTTE